MWNFFIFPLLFNEVNSANILGVIPTVSYSHQIPFWKIWRELSLKGHQVTVITTDPINNSSLTNLTEIDMHQNYEILNEIDFNTKVNNIENGDFRTFIKEYLKFEQLLMDRTLSHPSVHKLLSEKQDFDVVLVETTSPELFAFGELYDCPVIAITSLETSNIYHKMMGNSHHPILHPDSLLPLQGQLSLEQRFSCIVYVVVLELIFAYISIPMKNKIINSYFPNNSLTVTELMNNVDMLFINANPVFFDARPHNPNTIYIGGGNHIFHPKPLPRDLKDFLDNAKEGAIYFSLGSNVKSGYLNRKKIDIILESLKELPYRTIWKFENEELLQNVPSNVKLICWTPQQDVLRHPNVKLFITQGGLQSIEEAIRFNVPMVVMPFYGDQGQNAKRIVNKGIALEVRQANLNKEQFVAAIYEVINKPKYRENIIKLEKLYFDQPMTGVEKAVWWTEYVIRHKGAKHFKYPAWDIPLYQYYLLDIIGICIFIFSVILLCVILTVKCILICLKKLKWNKIKQN